MPRGVITKPLFGCFVLKESNLTTFKRLSEGSDKQTGLQLNKLCNKLYK